jgi:hypothetical protein
MAGRNGTKRDRVKKKQARQRTGEMEDRLGRLAHKMRVPFGKDATPINARERMRLHGDRVRG